MNLAVNPNCDIFSSFLIIMRLENKMKLSSKNKHIAKMLQAWSYSKFGDVWIW